MKDKRVTEKVKEICERAGMDLALALAEIDDIIEGKGVGEIGALQVWKSSHSQQLLQVSMDVSGLLAEFDGKGRPVQGKNDVNLMAHDFSIVSSLDGGVTVLSGVIWERLSNEASSSEEDDDDALDLFSGLSVGKCYLFEGVGVDPKTNRLYPRKEMTVTPQPDEKTLEIMSGKILSISEVGNYINERQCYTGVMGGYIPMESGERVGVKVGDPLADGEAVEEVVWYDTDNLDVDPEEFEGLVGTEVTVMARAWVNTRKNNTISLSGILFIHQ